MIHTLEFCQRIGELRSLNSRDHMLNSIMNGVSKLYFWNLVSYHIEFKGHLHSMIIIKLRPSWRKYETVFGSLLSQEKPVFSSFVINITPGFVPLP